MPEVRIQGPLQGIVDGELRTKFFAAERVDHRAPLAGQQFDAKPGAFMVDRKEHADQGAVNFWFTCPCGCGDTRFITCNTPTGWRIEGPDDAPTISPSIYTRKGSDYHWHGFFRAGVWEQA